MRPLLLLFLLGIFTVSAATAEPKQLICKDSNIDEIERLKQVSARLESLGVKGDSEKTALQVKLCENSSYGTKATIKFNTDSLQNNTSSKADISVTSCSKTTETNGVIQATLSSTPDIITFKFGSGRFFSLDRKTLMGGFNGESDLLCEIREVDVSENKI